MLMNAYVVTEQYPLLIRLICYCFNKKYEPSLFTSSFLNWLSLWD